MKSVEKIFLAYYITKKNNLYYNEIKENSTLSDSSLSRNLKELVNNNILSKEKTKSNVYYKIKNKKFFILEFSKLAVKQFEDLNIEVKSPLRNFIIELPNTIFTIIIFGSASQKQEQEGSDIDILLVSENKINLDKLKEKINITSNYPISIFYTNIKDLEKGKDNITTQAKKTGFPIFKEQNFYEVIINEY